MRRLIYSSIILSMLFASIALAVPPTTKYTPGETLSPNCVPGDTNCTIVTLATNNSILSEDGTVTVGGTGDTNNENLLLDFETTANTIGLSSSTGANTLDLGSTIALDNVAGITMEASNATTANTGGYYSENDGYGPYPAEMVSAHLYTSPLNSGYQYEGYFSNDINFTVDPAAGTFNSYGLFGGAYTEGINFNIARLAGIAGDSITYSSATTAIAEGGHFSADNRGSGTVTNAYGGEFNYGSNQTAGPITSAAGVYIDSPHANSEAHITNAYGVYIAGQDVGTVTPNRYQLYSAGTSPSYFAGPVLKSTTAGITAATGTQGTVTLTSQINEISTVSVANDDVTLPSAVAGLCVTVINNGGNNLDIWPASGDNIGLGVNTVLTGIVLPGNTITVCAYDATNWRII